MRIAVKTLFVTVAFVLGGLGYAAADPIDCPPGQAATLNPSEGGWVCVNQGGNTNDSAKLKNPNANPQQP